MQTDCQASRQSDKDRQKEIDRDRQTETKGSWVDGWTARMAKKLVFSTVKEASGERASRPYNLQQNNEEKRKK